MKRPASRRPFCFEAPLLFGAQRAAHGRLSLADRRLGVSGLEAAGQLVLTSADSNHEPTFLAVSRQNRNRIDAFGLFTG
jgi:hypothetical protein